MLISLRAYVVFLALALVLSGFVFACPQLTRDMGLDVWNLFSDEQVLQDALKRRVELDDIGERFNKRLSLRLIVVRDLIEGSISLAHATDDFISLNRVEPEIMGATRAAYPSDSDEESVVLQVMAIVKTVPSDHPGRRQEVIHRLERELKKMRENRSARLQ